MPARDYAAAVAALNTLQSNASVVAQIRKHGRDMNAASIPEMMGFVTRMGYQPTDFEKLHVIHVSGTKGKGSTSAFISSILGQYLQSSTQAGRLQKVGLFTSPHLRFVRERIQINGEPLSEVLFSKYFFEVWDKLSSTGDGSKPMYFRYLTIMALHAFLKEEVDSAIFECGIGGEYDATNIFQKPSVTAVTALGIDHTALLGTTLPEIAWHKAGIFRSGVPALTVPQPEPAMKVLEDRAAERGTQLFTVKRRPQIQSDLVKLGLAADFQKSNASLAVAVASEHLRKLGNTDIPDLLADSDSSLPTQFQRGLELVKWPGRCDIRKDTKSDVVWYLDGGHTRESLELSGQWFASECKRLNSRNHKVLIFNQQMRDIKPLIETLFKAVTDSLGTSQPFTHVIFTTNVTYSDKKYSPDLMASTSVDSKDIEEMKIQHEMAKVWKELDSDASTTVTRSIQDAIQLVRSLSKSKSSSQLSDEESTVLITGSLHLVGGAIEVLESGDGN